MALRCSSGVPHCKRVPRMPVGAIALLCKQTIDNFRTRCAPWRHLSGNRVLFVPHSRSESRQWIAFSWQIHQRSDPIASGSRRVFIFNGAIKLKPAPKTENISYEEMALPYLSLTCAF